MTIIRSRSGPDKGDMMKNKRKIYSLATTAIAIYILTATPIYADASCTVSNRSVDSPDESSNEIGTGIPDIWDIFDTLPTDSGSVSYLIDFYDPDGRFLDSKICHYGDKLENVIVPETKEDDRYIYQFSGWDPQLPETVTESMMFTAVYQKIEKPGSFDDPGASAGPNENDDDAALEPDTEETSEKITKASSDDIVPDGKTQVSSTSYDVTSFHIETPTAPKPETTLIPEGNPAPEDPAPTTGPANASGEVASRQKTPTASAPAQDPNIINAVGQAVGTPVPAAADIPPETVAPEKSSIHTRAKETPSVLPAETSSKTADRTKAKKEPTQETTARSAKADDQTIQKTSSNAARYSAMASAPVSEESDGRFLLPTLLIGLAVCGGTLFFGNKNRHVQ